MESNAKCTFLVDSGRKYVVFLGKRRRLRMKKRYYLGGVTKPVRRFRKRIRIYVRRKFRLLKRMGRRWVVRIRRKLTGVRRSGSKWYWKSKVKWKRIWRPKLILRLRKRRIRISRRRRQWYYKTNKKRQWKPVRRRVLCSIRLRGRRKRVKLVPGGGAKISWKGRVKYRRIIRRRSKLIYSKEISDPRTYLGNLSNGLL